MTTTTPTAIVEHKFIEGVETTQFTASSKTIVDAASVTNTSASATTLDMSIVPNGGSAGNENRSIEARNIRSDETYLCPELIGQTLEPGDFISALAGAASALNIRISGRVIT